MQGTIKTIVQGKGFGFISVPGQEKDIFFHADELGGLRMEDFKEGDVVTFEIAQGDKGAFAKNVVRADAAAM